jgi:hypothetical protein
LWKHYISQNTARCISQFCTILPADFAIFSQSCDFLLLQSFVDKYLQTGSVIAD